MNSFQLGEYILSAENVVKQLIRPDSPLRERFMNEGKLGCYICVGCAADGFPLLISSIADPLEVKREKYLELAQEKVRRLGSHPEHNLSRESADEKLDLYPGGVRGIDVLMSTSAYPADVDEIVSGAVLCRRR